MKMFTLTAACYVLIGLMAAADVVVLSDAMNYADDSAANAAWTDVGGAFNVWSTATFGPSPLSSASQSPACGSFLSLNNRVAYRDLSQTVTTNWSLCVKMLHNNYGRGNCVFMLDSTGTQGYGIMWNSANVNQFNGNGYVQIRKFNNSSYSNFGEFGTGSDITGTQGALQGVTGYEVTAAPDNNQDNATYDTSSWADFSTLQLDWEASTGTLKLYQNGTLMHTVADTGYSSFGRVYLRGNGRGFFDDVEVTTEVAIEPFSEIVSVESVQGSGRLKITADVGHYPGWYSPISTDDLVGGSWTNVAHASLSTNALIQTNLLYAASYEPTNNVYRRAFYVQADDPVRFFALAGNIYPDVYGASMPFETVEAEGASSISGSVAELGEPNPWPSTPAQEASGGAYVELDQTGSFLEFTADSEANAVVIRHCIPDAPTGGGIEATLGLYVNGQRRQDIQLSSKHNWLYGPGNPFENGQDNTPTGYPHVFWDEARLFIQGGIQAGDVIRLQKDLQDTAAYYRIDLIELEHVSAPLERPANSLSVVDYGATGQSASNDTAAIKACIADAKAQGKTVWFPAGIYLQNEYFELDGVKVRGAGMWYVTLYDSVGDASTVWTANAGFRLFGDGPAVSGLSLDSVATTRRNGTTAKGFSGSATNWVVEDVWISRLGVGFWMAGSNGVIRNCRVRTTYADGININNGNAYRTDNVLVENCHLRGTGDDSLAILCNTISPHLTRSVTLRNNTVVAPWWGAACDLAGGENHLIHNNLLMDGAGFVVNMPGAWPMKDLTDSVFRNNRLVRCGKRKAFDNNQRRGAIWIFPDTGEVYRLVIRDNVITQAHYRGIHLVGSMHQDIEFLSNQIIDSGDGQAVYIHSVVAGSGLFRRNISIGHGANAFDDDSTADYTVVDQGNSWQ